MKKLYIILALVVVSILMVFAGDTIKILRIYHNGTFTAIPLANIDSIEHSNLDTNGTKQAYYTSSIIETLDSTYNIPIGVIDSVEVDHLDISKYKMYVDLISNYISSHKKEISIKQFQDELLEWCGNCEWISEINVNETNDFINIRLINGLYFFIGFQDVSFGNDMANDQLAPITRNDLTNSTIEYIDITCPCQQKDDIDDIISFSDVLYINGNNLKWYNDFHELNTLKNLYSDSPIQGKIYEIDKISVLLNEDFSKYGIIIVSGTHGFSDLRGGFLFIDESAKLEDFVTEYKPNVGNNYISYNKNLILKVGCDLKTKHGKMFWDPNYSEFVFGLYPEVIGNKVPQKDHIVYGSYCYSYGLEKYIKGNTLFGYINSSRYITNDNYLIEFIKKMLNGNTFENAIKNLVNYNFEIKDEKGNVLQKETIPASNNKNSQLRYFSIKTNEITEEKGITGEIKGYKNLKTKDNADLKNKNDIITKWVLYAHEGTSKFTPKDNNVKRIEGAYVPDANGNFTISSDIVRQYPNHQFLVGFEYAGKVYYGQMPDILCPDNNHPHMIDLGLPSGTKWACCNVGAQRPEEYGGYFEWGSTIEKTGDTEEDEDEDDPYDDLMDIGETGYDVAYVRWGAKWRTPSFDNYYELTEDYCKREWKEVNGVGGYMITGPNGNRIFLPAAGYLGDHQRMVGVDYVGQYWCSRRSGIFGYCWYFMGGLGSWDKCVLRNGNTVRPVAR